MHPNDWKIYLGRIPHNETGTFWVSFESDPHLIRSKANIYGRCLPCIQHLYDQLGAGRTAIRMGTAFHCWKITAVLEDLDQCLALLSEYERQFPGGHVYGKLGSGRTDITTRVVVFHADDGAERDRLDSALGQCLKTMDLDADVLISRGCAVLYEPILGKWDRWQKTTPIRYPERIPSHMARLKKIMTTGKM